MHPGKDMSNFYSHGACALALTAVLAGCVITPTPTTQQLELHTILDHREVTGVGCVLSNSAGRWFVVAPGRVTVERTREPLTVDCAREGAGSAREQVAARADSRIDADKLIGNLIVRTPLDGYFDRNAGAGVAYPSIITVLMRPAQGSAGSGEASPDTAGPVMF